jgi:hypothetical protein
MPDIFNTHILEHALVKILVVRRAPTWCLTLLLMHALIDFARGAVDQGRDSTSVGHSLKF